jgi:hemerythrin
MNARESFEWSDDYSLNVKELDDDHKELLSMLEDSVRFPAGKLYFSARFNTLKEKIKEHFEKEENILQEIDYKKAKEHKQAHRDIFEKLTKINDAENTIELENEHYLTIVDLKETLIKHLGEHDFPAREYFKKYFDKQVQALPCS